jgi:hypothetical protein
MRLPAAYSHELIIDTVSAGLAEYEMTLYDEVAKKAAFALDALAMQGGVRSELELRMPDSNFDWPWI